MKRWMKLLAALICAVMILSLFPSGAVHAEDGAAVRAGEKEYLIYIRADHTDVKPGETVNFSIVLGPVDRLGFMQMGVVIPEGLEYVANSGKLADGLRAKLGFDSLDWTESSLIVNGYGAEKDYVSTEETLIATFSCRVLSSFTGSASISLRKLEFGSCVTWEEDTSQYRVVSDVLGAPCTHEYVRVPASAPTGTADGSIEHYTCRKCGKIFINVNGAMVEADADALVDESLHKKFVRMMYRNALGRELDFDDPRTGAADRQGFDSFTAALDAGMTGAEVASKFIFSSEMWDKNLCNNCYIEVLYKTILGRKPDDEGMAYWKSVLEYAGKTRIEVFNMFVQPDGGVDEFKNICVRYGVAVATKDITNFEPSARGLVPTGRCKVCGRSNVDDFITRLYRTCLLREPDTEGLNSWMAGLYNPDSDKWNGYTVAYRFVFGDEDPNGNHELRNQNLCNEHFVKRMYTALLDRELDLSKPADVEALNAYVGALDAGMSREEVFDKFVTSEEFKLMCVKAGIKNGLDNRFPIPAPGQGTYWDASRPCAMD